MKNALHYALLVFMLLILYGLLLLVSVGIANAQIVVTEDFNYSTGSLGGQWTALCSGHLASVKSPGLVYPGYIGSGIGNAGFFDTSGSEYKLTNNFNITSFAYMSFMISADGIQTGAGGTCPQGNDFVAAFQVSGGGGPNFNNHTGLILKSINSNQYSFGIQGPASGQILANGVYDVKTTYLVVLALDQNNYYLYINPPLDGGLATPDVTYPHGITYSSVDNIVLGQNNYGHIFIDGIRITSNLADVTINALAPEPAYPPANLTFANVTSNSLIVFYSAGQDNPTSSLAARNPGANVSFSPSDGSGYAVGEDVGNGDTISMASGCCMINESGLRPETNYFYRIYSANQTGDNSTINYLTSSYLEGSQYTLSVEPSSDPASFAASAASSSQLNLLFSSASTITNADGYVILRRQDGTDPTTSGFVDGVSGSSLTFPSGTTYLAFINANGVASLADGGLPANALYNYAIIPFNWDGSHAETINYHTGGTIKTSSSYTLTLPPNALAASNVGQTGFTASWDPVVGALNYSLDVSTDNFSTFISGYNNLIVPGTTNTIVGLSAGITYQYRVRAINSAGQSANSNVVSIITIPATPTAAAATAVTTNGFTANWNSLAGVSNYNLQVSSDGFASYASYDLLATAQLISGLQAGTTYQYQVRSENSNGVSAYSNIVSQITLPLAPNGRAATGITQTGFTANWNSVTGAPNYSLDVSTDNFVTFISGYHNLVVVDTTSIIIGLGAGKNYQYRVRAINAAGGSVNSNSVSASTIPGTPTATAATAVTTNSFTATWNSLTGVSNYNVEVSSDGFTTFTSYDLLATSQIISGLQAGTTYQYKVRSENSSGASAYSNTVSLILLPAPPAANASNINLTGFTANWSAVIGAATYSLDLSTDNFVTFISGYNSLTVTDISQIITGLSAGITYQYRVRAINATGVSANSNVVAVVTVPATPQAATDAVDQATFTATWNLGEGATNYFLDVSADNFITYVSGYQNLSVSSNTQVVTGLSPGVTYQYRVRAANANGASTSSTAISVLTLPPTPIAANASAIVTTSFAASWNDTTGSDSYSLEVSADNFATFLTGYPKALPSFVTNDTISGLSAGKLYKYRIKALNASGCSPYSNIISIPTVPLNPTGLSVSQTLSTGFVVNWAFVSGVVDHYEVDVSKDDFVSFVPGYKGVIVSATNNFKVVSNLLPATLYQFRVRTANSSGSSDNSSSAAYTLTSTGDAFNLQLASPTLTSVVTTTSIGTLSTQVSNAGTASVNVLFRHKKITENIFQTDTVFQTNGKYSATVNDNMLDELGIEYYFYAGDDFGRKDSTARAKIYQAFDGPSSPMFVKGKFSGSFNGYQIISIPYDLNDNLIETIFENKLGAYDVKKWRFGHYQNDGVLEYGNGINRVERGLGYWFNAKYPDSLQIRTGSGNAPKNDVDHAFTMTLSKGWNQIGNPYPFNIKWNDVLAANAAVTGVGSLKIFNNGNFKDGDLMKPFSGGFIFSDNVVTVSVPVSLRSITGGRAGNSIISSDLSGPQWQVTLTLAQGENVNDLGGIGMHPQAKDGKDDFDDLTLPRFGDYLELVHRHPDYFYATFSRDVIPNAATHTWKFTVESSLAGEEAKVSWNNALFSSSAASLFLLDVENGRVINMKERDSYSFLSQGRNEFQIFFSRTPTDFPLFETNLLGVAYPNPFSGSTNIPVVLAEGKNMFSVDLSVYDMTGKKSKTLAAGQMNSGYYNIPWDGTDDSGASVSSGIYIYHLVVDGKTFSRKVVLK